MLKEEGKYTQHWLKYAAVIRILLKKTDTEKQSFQLFKHEFDHSGNKNKTNITFSIDLINGRAANIVSNTGIARDLWRVLDENTITKNLLKERSVKITMNKSFELQLDRIAN